MSVCGCLLALSVVLAGCETEPPPCEQTADQKHEDLLIGYQILTDTLADESKLNLLKIFKRIVAGGTVDEVESLMERLSNSANDRGGELKKLRELDPAVTGKPATNSPIGDAITGLAKEAGTKEMLEDEPGYGLRALLLQAQATRMVSAICLAIAEFDPSSDRQAWLKAVSEEYEAHRDVIVAIISKYVRGQGDEQPER
jgi:hypothetical protein